MEVMVKNKVCSTCPFRKKNAHKLKLEMIEDMIKTGTISPCHQELVKYSGSEDSGVEIYAKEAPVFKVCRGYVESRILGDVISKDPLWVMLNHKFEQDGYSDVVVNMKDIV